MLNMLAFPLPWQLTMLHGTLFHQPGSQGAEDYRGDLAGRSPNDL